MIDYLEPGDKDAFLDWPKKKHPGKGYGIECPQCKGHGGWNLRPYAYRIPEGMQDTPEVRHRYVHFKSACGACWGYGYLQEGQTCAHAWVETGTVGKCLHEWTCELCGATREVDTND